MRRKPISDLELAPDATLGERVRYYRLLRGYTQEYLANECGTSTSRIRQIEKAGCSPRADTIEKIALVLEVNPDALMRPTDEQILESQQSEFINNLYHLMALYRAACRQHREIMTIQTKIMADSYEELTKDIQIESESVHGAFWKRAKQN